MTRNEAPVAVMGWGAANGDDTQRRAYTTLMRRLADAGSGEAVEVTTDEMDVLRAQPVVTWTPTCTLRVLERHYPSGSVATKLQQMWRASDGREHWRDVPTHVEQVTLDE